MCLKTRILIVVLIASVLPLSSWGQALPLFDNPPEKPQSTAEKNNSPSGAGSPSSSAAALTSAATASPSATAGQPLTIPAGTHVMLVLKSPLNSNSGTSGSA